MLSSAPVLLLPPPSEPLVLLVARNIATGMASGESITRRQVHTLLTDHFGGTDAEGRWSVRDAHLALELAQAEYLHASARIDLAASVVDADQMFSALESKLPTQTNHSNEQTEWQQFATPPRLAWLAARACALVADELVLEPSAGTGMLAVWASKAGTRLALNEISPLRRDCLSALFSAAPQQSSLPARAPFRLVAAPRRPLPTAARITPAASAIGSLSYQSLETPAPLGTQVGHYLPYRPSRIVIYGAAEHSHARGHSLRHLPDPAFGPKRRNPPRPDSRLGR